MPTNIDDLINNVINNVTDANDAIEDMISEVNEIRIGGRVIVADSKSPYWNVIGDVISIEQAYDEFSDADMLMAKVKVLRPMVQRSISMVGYPINSTNMGTQSDAGSEIVVPVDHLRCMTNPNGVVIKNLRAGGSVTEALNEAHDIKDIKFKKAVPIAGKNAISLITVSYGTNKRGEQVHYVDQIAFAHGPMVDAFNKFEDGKLSLADLTKILNKEGYFA